MLVAERCIRLRGDTRRPLVVGVLALTLAFGLWGSANASSLEVTPKAALDGDYGLRLALDGSEPMDTWVYVGPDKGLFNETALELSFLIDPKDLSATGRGVEAGSDLRNRHLCIVGFAQDLQTPRGLLLFLEPGEARGQWAVGVLIWDDALANYVVAGRALFWDDAVDREAVQLNVQWGTGQGNGYVRVSRSDGSGSMLLIDRSDLNNGSQAVNFMQVGVIETTHVHRSIRGDLDVDAFELNRPRTRASRAN